MPNPTAVQFLATFIRCYRECRALYSAEEFTRTVWPNWKAFFFWPGTDPDLKSESVLAKVASALDLDYPRGEPHRLDAALRSKDGTIVVGFEHEEDSSTFNNEIKNLSSVRCPLKVGVTHAIRKDMASERERISLKIADQFRRINGVIQEDSEAEYLFLVGCQEQAKDPCWYYLLFKAGVGPDNQQFERIETFRRNSVTPLSAVHSTDSTSAERNRLTACPELYHNAGLDGRFDSRRFRMLHQDGRRLIVHWFNNAYRQRHCDPAESFEPFICAWIALNGWASCCTDLDQDRQLIEALSLSSELGARFSETLNESPALKEVAENFRTCWPVFKAQELKRIGALTYWHGDRQRTVSHYLSRGATNLSPPCFLRHVRNGEEVPLDWPHVLAVIYKVRCNLFHGDKAPHSEIDRVLVHSSLQILVEFLGRWGYMP